MRVREPIIIDVEASGLGKNSYPIEVGVALSGSEKYCTLIQPALRWTDWDAEAEKVHRVPRDILETYGRPVREVALRLNELLAAKVLYSDGWVVDKPWLTMLFHAAGVNMEFWVSPLEYILSDFQMEHWHQIKNELIETNNITRHRASADAWLIRETYIRSFDMARKAEEKA